MKKTIFLVSILSVVGTIICAFIYLKWNADLAFTFAITFGTTAYHLLMRLLVGFMIDAIMKNHADYSKKRYQCRTWESRLYKYLNVRKWKKRLPTFQPQYFDPNIHSWEEIAQAMCQAEIVHELIVVLSFIPILFSTWFGALAVFAITSVFAALFDLLFVILQRYNRPRIIKLIERKNAFSSKA